MRLAHRVHLWICHLFISINTTNQLIFALEPDTAIARVITFERDLFPRKEAIARSPLRRCLGWLAQARRRGTSLDNRQRLASGQVVWMRGPHASFFIHYILLPSVPASTAWLVHVADNWSRRRKRVTLL